MAWDAKAKAGIIPAYAGSTTLGFRFDLGVRDHPRIRGEHQESQQRRLGPPGSSPHTRGALADFDPGSFRVGIIPAYAGSTVVADTLLENLKDHPRIRGEHSGVMNITRLSGGSSPHTRGAQHDLGEKRGAQRIIPAYAGSTLFEDEFVVNEGDHPRIRGEHQHDVETSSSHTGSSPHTRGARGRECQYPSVRRIIPAYAGSTSSYPTCELPRTDHPRIRGEHSTS